MTHIARVECPSSTSTRSRISWAALLVKVMARISLAPGLPGADQEGDAMGEDAGLARARAGEDQQRPLAVDDRLALGLVEAGQQRVDAVVGGGLAASRLRIRRAAARPAGGSVR